MSSSEGYISFSNSKRRNDLLVKRFIEKHIIPVCLSKYHTYRNKVMYNTKLS